MDPVSWVIAFVVIFSVIGFVLILASNNKDERGVDGFDSLITLKEKQLIDWQKSVAEMVDRQQNRLDALCKHLGVWIRHEQGWKVDDMGKVAQTNHALGGGLVNTPGAAQLRRK